ncbi:MAG: polysaccharide deacetylase family protein [Terriglobia bacterium]
MQGGRARKIVQSSLAFLFLSCVSATPVGRAALPPQNSGRVYVVLWFDTEDYILPQSDDAAKRIAVFLTQQGIHATFKVVGEKARTLERRGRTDVIRALAQHEIGYHSNLHSQHPTVAEYEAPLDWEGGIREFDRRERPGYNDLRRIFGKAPTCYGQPGDSWSPQAFAALKSWGVKVYLDEGAQVGLNGKPFWYGGLLNIFNTVEGPTLRPNDDWSNLAEAKAHFQDYYSRMTSEGFGGIISIYFHPCEFIHREFWDGVNFAHGANPPRDQWKLPPMKTPEKSENTFKYLEDLVVFMKSFPRVQFVTASGAYNLFRDGAQQRPFRKEELGDIARQVGPEVSFQVRNHFNLSASEVLLLLNQFVAGTVRKNRFEPVRLVGSPYGPSLPPLEFARQINVPWSQFARTVLDVQDFLDKNNQVPSAVWFGSTAVPPESYLVALARVTATLAAHLAPPQSVTVGPAHLAVEKYVADDSVQLWDWPIFPLGFHAPNLMALAKRQAWTVRPAILRRPIDK